MLLDLRVPVDDFTNKESVIRYTVENYCLTPLHYAAINNHIESVSLLLDRGAYAKKRVDSSPCGSDDALMLSLRRLYDKETKAYPARLIFAPAGP